jgi:hypothetical protein
MTADMDTLQNGNSLNDSISLDSNRVNKAVTNVLPGESVHNTNGHAQQPTLQPIEATQAYAQNPLAYELSKIHFLSSRRLKVIVAGAGASALSFAHEVETGALQNIDLQILEKNSGLGGTWFENQYPGCACDIPSHAYLVLPTFLKSLLA